MTDKPQNDDEKERDEVLKRMLNTPPDPQKKSTKKTVGKLVEKDSKG